ncbi:MAG: AAA family ATPase [Pseudomonadota bacterium]
MQSLVIIRGLPGSGKTTLAQRYVEHGFAWTETDLHMLNEHGRYAYNLEALSRAIVRVEADVTQWLAEGRNVVVSGVYTRLSALSGLLHAARHAGVVRVHVLEPDTPWAWDIEELKRRTVHGVPHEKIQKMLDGWEPLKTGGHATGKLIRLASRKHRRS